LWGGKFASPDAETVPGFTPEAKKEFLSLSGEGEVSYSTKGLETRMRRKKTILVPKEEKGACTCADFRHSLGRGGRGFFIMRRGKKRIISARETSERKRYS